jgi:membrane associated rhomboid family serine protease
MILPVGHEEGSVRRLPWVSFGVMALCLLAFIATKPSSSAMDDGADELWSALEYYLEHPYLELDPTLSEALGASGADAFLEAARESIARPSDETVATEQERLDDLTATALATLGVDTYRRWGLVPAHLSVHAFVTYIFMHGGWLHLIGNLLLFYLAAPFIEDVWGRPGFAAFFLIGGIVAAFAHVVRYPDSLAPMIGASGAVSAVMGAFLVRYWHTKIRFFYMFGIIIRGTFDAPAWAMLPLWFFQQVFLATLTDSLGSGVGGGVAYWAHIGGFLFGIGVAVGMKHFDVEERFLHSAIETKVNQTHIDNSAVERALEAHARGATDEALAELSALVEKDPANEDAVLAYWSLCTDLERSEDAAPAMVSLVEAELRSGTPDVALAHWTELDVRVANPPAGPELMVRISQALVRDGRTAEAAVALRRAMLEAGSGMTANLAMRIARVAKDLDPRIAQGAARVMLARPDLDPSERAYAEKLLRETSGSNAPRLVG